MSNNGKLKQLEKKIEKLTNEDTERILKKYCKITTMYKSNKMCSRIPSITRMKKWRFENITRGFRLRPCRRKSSHIFQFGSLNNSLLLQIAHDRYVWHSRKRCHTAEDLSKIMALNINKTTMTVKFFSHSAYHESSVDCAEVKKLQNEDSFTDKMLSKNAWMEKVKKLSWKVEILNKSNCQS